MIRTRLIDKPYRQSINLYKKDELDLTCGVVRAEYGEVATLVHTHAHTGWLAGKIEMKRASARERERERERETVLG